MKDKAMPVQPYQWLRRTCGKAGTEVGAPLGVWSAQHAPALTRRHAVLKRAHTCMFGIIGKLLELRVRQT